MTLTFSTTQETRFYLDTMIPYALLRATDPGAQALFRRIEAGEITAYTSTLTFDELAYRLLLALIRDTLPGSPLDRLRQAEQEVMSRFGAEVGKAVESLARLPNLHIVPVLPDDIGRMSEAMGRYYLRPRDGLHLAAMERADCYTLISHDAHFDRLPHVQRFTL